MGFVVKAVKSVVKVVVKIAKTVIMGGLGLILGGMRKKGNAKNAASDRRLSKQLDPEDFKKIVFGKTAMAVDLRYWEVYSPPAYNRYAEVLSAAGHRVNSFGNLYIEDDLVPFSGNNATGTYAGVLTRRTNTGAPGNAALPVGSGSYWNTNSKFTGVAHYALDWLVDEKKLPNGVPSRYTQEGEGALVYDPRKDSTRGGVGTHRADDQSTWQYSPLDSNNQPIGRNNALQMLWYLIGWRVQNPVTLEWTLVCGRGVDLNDINFADFIAAANDAEALGYYSDMILSTGDDHEQNEAIISADGLFGEILDPGGLWTYKMTKDDTADWAVHLTDDDVVEGEVTWDPQASREELFNEISGTYIDPSATSLYQAKAYPTVKDATYLTADGGRRKRDTHNFQSVQDPALAQKLARIKLNRTRFTGEFQATFNLRALKAQAWSVVKLTLEQYGFVAKWFRVVSQSITPYGIEMQLREEDPSIYSGGTVTIPAAPSSMVKYNIRQEIAVTGLSGSASTRTGIGGAAEDGVLLSWTTPPGNVRRTEAQYKRTADVAWTTAMVGAGDVTACFVGPLLSSSTYEMRVRHVSIHEVPGPWATVSVDTGANGRVVWTSVANRPPLLTGPSLTVDETFKDPSVYSLSNISFGTSATGEGYVETPPVAQGLIRHLVTHSVPIDFNATYEATWDLQELGAGAGVAAFYTIVECFDAAGDLITGDGTYWYYPTGGLTLTSRGAWETHGARFGKGTDRPFPANAVRFGLGVYTNFFAAAGSGATQVRRMLARKLTTLEMQSNVPCYWALGDGKAIRQGGTQANWGVSVAYGRAAITGPQRVTWRWSGPDVVGHKMCGLTELASPTIYNTAPMMIYYTATAGRVAIYSNGVEVAVYTGITTRNTDEFGIEYDGLKLYPLRNGARMGYSLYVGPDKTYRMLVDSYWVGQGVIQLDHKSTNSLSVIGSNTVDINGNPISLDALRNNMIDVAWWKKGAVIPWLNPGGGGSRLMVSTPVDINVTGLKSNPEDSLLVFKTGASGATVGGGWNPSGASQIVGIDPDKTYRLVLPVRRIGGDSSLYFGVDGAQVATINTTTVDSNPYFVQTAAGYLETDRWYIFVGYIYPRNSIYKSNDSAGVYDCRTGKKIAGPVGTNFCFLPGFSALTHRAFQYYGTTDSSALFGRPMCNVVDGTEPELSTFFEATSALEDVSLDWTTTNLHIVQGNTVSKAIGAVSSWDGKAVTRQSYKSNAFISGRLETDGFLGLHELGNTSPSYTSMLHSVHRSGDGNWYYWSGAAAVLNMGTARNGVTFGNLTDWAIFYDNATVKIFADGVSMHEVTAASDKTFQGAVALYSQTHKVSNVRFGPFTENTVVTTLPPPDVTINATYSGTIISGQFNKIMTPTVKRGGSDARTDNRATYTVTNITGGLTTSGYVTLNNTTGSADKGRVTISNCTASGTYTLNIFWEGVLINSYLCKVNVVPADPPVGGGGGGGGGTKSGTFDIAGQGFSTTAFVELGRVSGLVKAAGETIRCSLSFAGYQYVAFFGSDSRAAVLKFQYSVAGAESWTNLGSQVAGSQSYWDNSSFSGTEGSVSLSPTAAPANNTYDVRVVGALDTSTSGGNITFVNGIASVTVGV